MSYMTPSVFCPVGSMVGGVAESPVVPPVVPVPVNTVAPALDDTAPGIGDTVTCGTGTWSNTPTSYAYQWKRDGANIGGATSNSYLVDAADEGAVLTCAVTASNAGGAGSPATSDATDPIPGSFGPTDIADLLYYPQADLIVGLSNNDPVSQWDDESGNGYNFTQATGGNQPTYIDSGAFPVVRFGADDWMRSGNVTVPTNVTVFAVIVPQTAADYGVIMCHAGSNGTSWTTPYARYGIRRLSTGSTAESWIESAAVGGNFNSYASVLAANTPVMVAVRYNGTTLEVFVNGVANTPVTTSHSGNLTGDSAPITLASNAGAGDPWHGDIFAVPTYGRALTDAELNQLGAYYEGLTGITWTPIP